MIDISGNSRLHTVNYKIKSNKIPSSFDGIRIVMLSDLHCNLYGINNELLLERVRVQKPDYVMIAGDMIVSNGRAIFIALSFIRQLVKEFPVYYGLGNHEYKMEREPDRMEKYKLYQNKLQKAGVIFLNNESISLDREGQSICVSGISIGKRYYKRGLPRVRMMKSYVDKLIGKSEQNSYHILLAHNPEYFPTYSNWGADLVLSGHVHGGIVILPWLGGVLAPSLRLFPKYDFGRFIEKDSTMIISKGLGLHTIKFRLFNWPEVVTIDLNSKGKNGEKDI